jgi:hypothetical protein
VQLSRGLHADEEVFINELSRGVGDLAFASGPKLLLTSPLEASQLPVLGAVSGESAGKGEALKGAVVGWLYHGGMKFTGARMGRAGNSLFWTGAGTVDGVAEGKPVGSALAGALPMGALAAAGGERRPVEVTDPKGVTRPATVEDLPAINSGELKPVLNALTGKEMAMPARGERGAVPLNPVEIPPERQSGKNELTPVPETSATINAQVESMQAGRRDAVLVTRGARMPKTPAGYETLETEKGTFIFDPKRIAPDEIESLVAENRHGLLLGHVEPKSESTTVVVVARHPETGAELQASYASPGKVEQQKAAMLEQYPGAHIEVGGKELDRQIIADRQRNQAEVILDDAMGKAEAERPAIQEEHITQISNAWLDGEHAYSYTRHPDGVFTISARGADGKTVDVAHATAEELPKLVGEETAKEMLRGSGAGPVRSSPLDIGVALFKVGLIGPKTHARNILSTGGFQIMEEAARLPASVVDMVASAFTGKRTVTGPNVRAAYRSSYEAATKGLSEAKQIVMKGATDEQLARYDSKREISSGSKLLDLYVNGQFRLLAAEDQVFRTYALRRSLEDQARVQAINEAKGQKGTSRAKVAERTRELVEHPTTEMQARAIADSEVATFNNPNLIHSGYTAAREAIGGKAGGRAVNAVLDLNVPFVRTPLNIVARLFEYSPVGAVTGTARAANAVVNKAFTPEQQRAFARTMGRATTGTALILMGYTLGKKGLLTGSRPDDYMEAEREVANKRPFGSLRIGDRWQQISDLSPVSSLMIIGADLAREDEKGDITGGITKTLTNAALDQPFGRRAEDVSDVVGSPGKQGMRHAGRLAGSFVPTVVADAASALDSKERTKGSDFWNQITYRVPGLRNLLPEKTDLNGEPVEHSRSDAINPFPNRRALTADEAREQETRTFNSEVLRGSLGPQDTELERVVSPLLETDTYSKFPDDETKKEAIKHAANYVKKYAGQLPDEALANNARVVLEQHRLDLMVDNSSLPDERKALVKKRIEARFKTAWVFDGDKRDVESVGGIFERRRTGVDEWLDEQMSRKDER